MKKLFGLSLFLLLHCSVVASEHWFKTTFKTKNLGAVDFLFQEPASPRRVETFRSGITSQDRTYDC